MFNICNSNDEKERKNFKYKAYIHQTKFSQWGHSIRLVKIDLYLTSCGGLLLCVCLDELRMVIVQDFEINC